MMESLEGSIFNWMPWYWLALLVIAITSSCAAVGLLVFRRLANQHTLRKDQEIASYALNTIALLYCVIVGFVVIRVQDHHNTVNEITIKEANILLNLYYSSCDVFPSEMCLNIRKTVQDYAKDVVYKEWPLMIQGKDIALVLPSSIHSLWMIYDRIEPKTNGQMARYQEALTRLNELSEARFGRLSNVSSNEGTFMWTVLIYGGVLVVVSSYLFASSCLTEHLIQLVFITSFISLVLLLIYSLDSPYSGPTAVGPKAFRDVLELVDVKYRPM